MNRRGEIRKGNILTFRVTKPPRAPPVLGFQYNRYPPCYVQKPTRRGRRSKDAAMMEVAATQIRGIANGGDKNGGSEGDDDGDGARKWARGE